MDGAHRVLPDDGWRPADIDSRQLGRTLEQCVCSDTHPGRDRTPQVFPLSRDGVERGRRTEIHDTGRPAMEMKHCNRVYNSISSKRMLGIFITNLQASLYACINDEGFNVQIALARLLKVARERGDNRSQCNRL